MILVEGLIWTPLGFLLLSAVFRSVRYRVRGSRDDERRQHRAPPSGGSRCGSRRRRCSRCCCSIFIRAFEAFDIPALVGSAGGVSVLTTAVFDSIRKEVPSNYGQAGAFSIVLMAVVAVLLYLHGRILQRAERYQTITGKGFRPRVLRLGRWRYARGAMLCLFFIVLLVVPLGIIVLASLLPFYDGVSADAFGRLTLDNYRLVAGSESFRGAILNTLIMGAATATAVCAADHRQRLARGAPPRRRLAARSARDAAADLPGDRARRRLPAAVPQSALQHLRHAVVAGASPRPCNISRMECGSATRARSRSTANSKKRPRCAEPGG